MSYFGGINKRQIDEKNRLPIPKEWRDAIVDSNNNVVAIARLNKIEIYPCRLFDILIQKEVELGLNRGVTDIKSKIGSVTEIKELDSKGRIQLSERLLSISGIDGNSAVLVVGAVDHLAIWKPDVFEEYDKSNNIDDIL